MYLHEWFWYIRDPYYVRWYFLMQGIYRDKFKGKKHSELRLFRLFLSLKGELNGMASKRKSNTGSGTKTDNGVRWVNVSITDDHEQQLNEFMALDGSAHMGFLCTCAERGFSFSLKQATDGGYMCSLIRNTRTDDGGEPFGVSAFSGQPDYAVIGVLFKLVVLLDFGGSLPDQAEAPKRLFR